MISPTSSCTRPVPLAASRPVLVPLQCRVVRRRPHPELAVTRSLDPNAVDRAADTLLGSHGLVCAKLVPEMPDIVRLSGEWTSNDVRRSLFSDLEAPATNLVFFLLLVLAVYLLSKLRVGEDLFDLSKTDEPIPRNVEELEEAMKVYKEVPPEQQTEGQAGMVEELLREKAELLHERERGLVWLAGITLAAFWCAGLVNTL